MTLNVEKEIEELNYRMDILIRKLKRFVKHVLEDEKQQEWVTEFNSV